MEGLREDKRKARPGIGAFLRRWGSTRLKNVFEVSAPTR